MKKYLIYGSSILFGRGLEYIILLIAAFYLSKKDYGSLEFYKKIIELGAAMLTFGMPTLILSYPKSKESKIYLTFLALMLISILTIAIVPIFSLFSFAFILIPIYFLSIFFNGGIFAPFILTHIGSNTAALYKSIISLVFYLIVLLSVLYSKRPDMAFVYVSYILLPIMLIYTFVYVKRQNIVLYKLKKYWRLFKRLILSSLTIVVSNFANMMFLYTDILLIKLLFDNAAVQIANYSFSLNIANALILIPLTLVQVDIEKLKFNLNYANVLRKKIFYLVILAAAALVVLYLVLTHYYFENYSSTLVLFVVILGAKIFQAISVSYGAVIIIKKLFSQNLYVNLASLILNIVLSYLLYQQFGLIGIAAASFISLFVRFLLLLQVNKRYSQEML